MVTSLISILRERLLEKAGFATIDLGGLREGGRLQQFGGPFAVLNLVRLG